MCTKSLTHKNIEKAQEKQRFSMFWRIDHIKQIFSFLQHVQKIYEKTWRREQTSATCPKSLPRCPQDVPRPSQHFPRRPKMDPRWRQDPPKRSSDAPKTPPDAPKTFPRCIQADLRTPKPSTKAPRESPRPSQDAPDPPLKTPIWSQFGGFAGCPLAWHQQNASFPRLWPPVGLGGMRDARGSSPQREESCPKMHLPFFS